MKKTTFNALFAIATLWLAPAVHFTLGAQGAEWPPNGALIGSWTLDSVQVTETAADGLAVCRTVRPPERGLFDHLWMWNFTLGSDGLADYTEPGGQIFDRISWSLETRGDDGVLTLTLCGVPLYKTLAVHALDDAAMLLTLSFNGVRDSNDAGGSPAADGGDVSVPSVRGGNDVRVDWILFYRKTERT